MYNKVSHTYMCVCVCVCVRTRAQSCPTLCGPVDCSLPDSSVHAIFQARILEWVAISSSRGIFLTQGSNLSLISPALSGGFFITSTTWKTHTCIYVCKYIICSLYSLLKVIEFIEYSSLCYAVDCLFYIVLCVYVNPKLLIYPSPLSPLVTVSLFSMSVGLFLSCK